ncbi:hypothetical protein GCM10012280_54730 [Wenjunlia tyrosinilytica]|uniref:Thioesterase n=1 Tax=Wenjunlia tyrosinilytica TaxID=1544741 RepID=A0A917ZVM6_9ACTN|nr:hypothetical protein GCM10012280_54730 [Wenjunlia tyrosinilytica]
MVDTWSPYLDAPRLTVPTSVFGAEDDPVVPLNGLGNWDGDADRFLGLHLYRGGHFYLRANLRPLVRQIIASALAAARARD